MKKILAFLAEHPDMLKELYLAASEIVDDFDDFGETLQANIDGEYDESSPVQKLRKARDEIVFGAEGYWPSSTKGPLNGWSGRSAGTASASASRGGSFGFTISVFSRSHVTVPGGDLRGLRTYFLSV